MTTRESNHANFWKMMILLLKYSDIDENQNSFSVKSFLTLKNIAIGFSLVELGLG